jgi:threonine dehydrogenase-like Zn-dependent dehydrogenase
VFGAVVDKFPIGTVINKGLMLRGAQQRPGAIPMLLDRIATGDSTPRHLVTHELPLDDGPRAYKLFKHKDDGCVRVVLWPGS